MIQLSAVIITYNEEQRIAQCLQSLVGIADDIVVLDSYSTDQTVAICRQFPLVRFAQQTFVNFAQQKNAAIAMAHHPYVLSIDADEVVSDELRQQIQQLKKQWTHDLYGFKRRNYCGNYWVRYGGWYPDRKWQLFDRRKAQWTGGGSPHAYVAPLTVGATSKKRLSGYLLHYTAPNLAQWVAKIDHYSAVLSAELQQKGQTRVGWYQLLLKPWWRFFRAYVLQLGFLDGKIGFVLAAAAANGVFTRYVRLLQGA